MKDPAVKIAILTIGTRGDTQPYIALGKALKTRGHDVVLAAPDNFAAWVEGHGLAYRPIGIDMQVFIQSPEARQIMAGNVLALARIWRRTVVPMMRGSLDATWEAARDAEMIVYHPKAGGAVDMAAMAAIGDAHLLDMIARVQSVSPDIGLGIFVFCNVGDDSRTKDFAAALGNGLYSRFTGPPAKVAEGFEWLAEQGITRCQISPLDDASFDRLAPVLL